MKWARYGDKKNVGTRPVSDKLLTNAETTAVFTRKETSSITSQLDTCSATRRQANSPLSSFDEAKLLHDRHRTAA